MDQKRLLEIACFNLASAQIAQEAGADRIELCSNYWEGGITPSETEIIDARHRIKVPLHVMVRCRAGDFYYSETEFNNMCLTVEFSKKHNIDGIVIGILSESNDVDVEACRRLMKLAGNMSVTFHRAIDHCSDMENAFEDLIELGVHRVLTTGGAANVMEGFERLKKLQDMYGSDIIIMPGGGLRSTNIQHILQSGCNEFHSSALTTNAHTVSESEIKKIKKYL